MRAIGLFLVLSLIITPVLAETAEVSALATPEAKVLNIWQEADITFWQTLPFAAIFGYFIDRQLSNILYSGASAHWGAISAFAIVVSAGNAFIRTRRIFREKSEPENEFSVPHSGMQK